MTSNEAIVFSESGNVSIQEQPRPAREGDEVVIKTTHSLISTGTELTMLAGDVPEGSAWDEYSTYPIVAPGYCNVGRVVESSHENSFEEGDRVATWNGHAGYVTAADSRCVSVPEDVPGEEAVFFAIAQIVMNGLRKGRIDWGETVGVYGLGLLGQLTVRFSHIAGACPIFGMDLSPRRLSFLPDKPHIIGDDPSTPGWKEAVKAKSHGRMADVIFEVTGNPAAITTEFEFLRDEGRLVVLSSPHGKTTFDFHDYCNRHSYQLIGAHESSHPLTETPQTPWTKQHHAELFFEYLADGRLDVSSLITHRPSIHDAPAIYELLQTEREKALGVVIEWE